MTLAAIARLVRRLGRRPSRLALAAMLARAFLLELVARVVDLQAQEIRPSCRKSDAIVDGKRRRPTPAVIEAREMAPGCRGTAGSGATVDEVQRALDRLDASLASLLRDQNRPMSGPPAN
jgi:hypothetical protein